MSAVLRPIAFVLAASNHGTMIVNRNDYCMTDPKNGFGVGHQIFLTSSCEQGEVDLAVLLLKVRRHHKGDGVVGLDCGANIGTHTVEWSRAMHGWGSVLSFEAQERVYYALAGNVALNNCLNASVKNVAVGASCGVLNIPQPDYTVPSSFGSLELRQRGDHEFIGQQIDYSNLKPVDMVSIDSLNLPRVDLIKIDVEGMEMEVLNGASDTITRCQPVLLIETIKCDVNALQTSLVNFGYTKFFGVGINLLAIHEQDSISESIKIENGMINFV